MAGNLRIDKLIEMDIWGKRGMEKGVEKDYYCVPPPEMRRAKIRMTLSFLKTSHLQITRERKKTVLQEFLHTEERRD